jgi:hypothetical protein
MRWTQEKPTREGYYWFLSKRKIEIPQKPILVEVMDWGLGLYILQPGSEETYEMAIFEEGYWIGPLEIPSKSLDMLLDEPEDNP